MIRKAELRDMPAICRLLEQLDYPGTENFLHQRLEKMLTDPAETLLVWEAETHTTPTPSASTPPPTTPTPPTSSAPAQILGILSLHFIPQLALEGDFARISYFAIDTTARGTGIGREMEEYATQLAREKGCQLVEVHCHTRRTRAHDFYFRQGYEESPKYLIKRLK